MTRQLGWATGCLIILTVAAECFAQLKPEMIASGKKATALVEISPSDNQRAFGSAFCIDPSGVFVTNCHVVESARGGNIKLVLNPSESDQRIVQARILRSDKALDLAVLQAEGTQKIEALELGSAADLIDTLQLTAFGYPFGPSLSLERGEYPSISVNTGRITSLRKKRGELELIQLDASLNPGNSGGPVLDPKGKVVGIVQGGIAPANGINFAIPISRLESLLSKPEISLAPQTIPFDKRSEGRDFSIKVTSFARPRPDYAVELTFGDLQMGTRRFTASRGADGNYIVRAAALPLRTGPKQLQVVAKYALGSVNCRVADIPVSAGDQRLKLSDVSHIGGSDQPAVLLRNGTKLSGPLTGIQALTIDLGDVTTTLDLSKAIEVSVDTMDRPVSSVDYKVVVKAGDRIVGEAAGSVTFSDAPNAAGGIGGVALTGAAPLEAERVVRRLPGTIDAVVAGGGGRFLLLHLRKLRKLAIFDVAQAKVVQLIALASDDVLYAASSTKLFLVMRDQGVVQRWDLNTLQKELTIPLPETGQLDQVVMGYASSGPLMLMTRTGPKFMDTATLKLLDIKLDNQGGNWFAHPQYPLRVCASADGSTFAAWEPGLSPTGIRVLWLEGAAARGRYEHASAGTLMPSYDGTMIFTSAGIYSSDLKPLSPERFQTTCFLPSYHPAYFLGYQYGSDPRYGGARPRTPGAKGNPGKLSIYTSSDKRLLISLNDLEEFSQGMPGPYDRTALSVQERIHLIPQANLLVTIGEPTDTLVLRRFVTTEVLDKAGIDYLFVNSLPLRDAKRGQPYRYSIDVKSKRGGVQYSLDSGPEGMKISNSGVVEWNVPSDYKAGSISVIVGIKDASGQDIFHTYTVDVK